MHEKKPLFISELERRVDGQTFISIAICFFFSKEHKTIKKMLSIISYSVYKQAKPTGSICRSIKHPKLEAIISILFFETNTLLIPLGSQRKWHWFVRFLFEGTVTWWMENYALLSNFSKHLSKLIENKDMSPWDNHVIANKNKHLAGNHFFFHYYIYLIHNQKYNFVLLLYCLSKACDLWKVFLTGYEND